jgi:hypothetical protein
VAVASSVNVTEPGECTTSASSLAARSTACVPLGLPKKTCLPFARWFLLPGSRGR